MDTEDSTYDDQGDTDFAVGELVSIDGVYVPVIDPTGLFGAIPGNDDSDDWGSDDDTDSFLAGLNDDFDNSAVRFDFCGLDEVD